MSRLVRIEPEIERIHWTQTPRGRKKMAELARRRKGNVKEKRKQEIAPEHVAYCLGRCEALIDFYADGAGISRTSLALGVAEVLRHKASR